MTSIHLKKRGAVVVAIKLNDGCVKMQLPNGKVVDILTAVLDEISEWLQDNHDKPESGGYIIGYQHKDTGNIVLESVSVPQKLDKKTRIRFDIKDPSHNLFLKRAQRNKSYYMGVWHTHPQDIPVPSSIDWEDWKQTLAVDKTGSEYIFFIIAGTVGTRVWVGNKNENSIIEIEEVFEFAPAEVPLPIRPYEEWADISVDILS